MTRRSAPRVRLGRVAALAAALGVTTVSVLGGLGAFETATPETASEAAPASASAADRSVDLDVETSTPRLRTLPDPDAFADLPSESGEGRRAVFKQSTQRVWIVDADEQVQRTYRVSGSALDNLDPGTYEVFSRSRNAVGIDDSGTMEFFVRFTRGPSGAAIGFHSIPVDDGASVQTVAQLGLPLSSGCIRQKRSDAIAMWRFADLGTRVDVVA